MVRCFRLVLVLALVSCSSHDAPPVPDDTAAKDEGTTAMAEGKMGLRVAHEDPPPELRRQEAIEASRSAGVLGSTEISSGFDGSSVYGTIGHGGGTGAGYGVGGGRGRAMGQYAMRTTTRLAKAVPKATTGGWVETGQDHLSTFGADVDTASYTYARRVLGEGSLPEAATVRPEEFVNYFTYAAPAPSQNSPFGATVDVVKSPLDPARYLMRVELATKPKAAEERKPAHLVFLVDVSGSMTQPDRLPLAKQALHVLTENLGEHDTVAIVTYAGATRVVLPVTPATNKGAIEHAIDQLNTGGGTAMGAGLDLAYAEALKGVEKGAVSRVIVCTDGDANLGTASPDGMLGIIAERAMQGVMLSAVGFGRGNYKDATLEELADKGNGNFSYIDSLAAARKVFGAQLGGTLEVVGKDTKLQVDFDTERVARYRLIGYEDRAIADKDFRDDKVDAGEVGAGHQVTAIYELELAKSAAPGLSLAPIATVRVRYKAPDGETATEVAFPGPSEAGELAAASDDMRFAAATAMFAEMMRDGKLANAKPVRDLAASAVGQDKERQELVRLMDVAIKLAATKS